MNTKPIIEKEFRLLIPKGKLFIIPPCKIGDFSLESVQELLIEDVLLEREKVSLKSENVGARARKTGEKLELTYKKFLGKEGGAARFDETTLEISKESFEEIRSDNINGVRLGILNKLAKKGRLYLFLTIVNKRKIYNYSDNETKIEMAVEDLLYLCGEKIAKDAIIEIEIKSPVFSEEKIQSFVTVIKNFYKGSDTSQGKNGRAMALLGINLNG